MYLREVQNQKFPTPSPTAQALRASPQTKFTIDVAYPNLASPSAAASALWALAHTMYVIDVFLL